MKKYTEDEFDEKYELVGNHIDNNASFSGKMFETYGEEMEYVLKMNKQNRVITIIETEVDEYNEEGELLSGICYSSGLHLVNRLGFLITKEPFFDEFEVNTDW